ncbi:hypothetical protein HanOQP8_Chr13g0471881 [Helianthus annuus]|nr:hypothetical protein HanLR1_Chr13g0472901 [Helianthus annuus]KAJ0670235.1 hypothetical protein HanOQP8_Chr13g0471881 [Helianthus annuus]
MKSSYDQLLVDHLRLVNGMFITFSTLFFLASDPLLFSLGKTEIGRARDKAIESHQVVVADMKDMLTRYDGEMVELYSLTSELLLTKQWFLTEGVAWVVKLVHQSPELEKVVADLVNSVNVVGVNDILNRVFKLRDLQQNLLRKFLGMMKEPRALWMLQSTPLMIFTSRFLTTFRSW